MAVGGAANNKHNMTVDTCERNKTNLSPTQSVPRPLQRLFKVIQSFAIYSLQLEMLSSIAEALCNGAQGGNASKKKRLTKQRITTLSKIC